VTSSVLERELSALQSLQFGHDETSSDVCDVAMMMLSCQLSWQRKMESQLLLHGIEITADDDEDIGKLLNVVSLLKKSSNILETAPTLPCVLPCVTSQ